MRCTKVLIKISLVFTLVVSLSACGSRAEKSVVQEVNSTEKERIESEEQGKNTEYNEAEKLEKEYELVDVFEYAEPYKTYTFSQGVVWIQNRQGIWQCIDKEGNIRFDLLEGYEPAGNFIGGICLVASPQEQELLERKSCRLYHTLIGLDGKFALTDFIGENDAILLVAENNGSADIWIKSIVDSYEGYSVQLKVMDETGKIKAEFFPNDIMSAAVMEGIHNVNADTSNSMLRSCGDGMYSYGSIFFDVNNSGMFVDEIRGPGGHHYIDYNEGIGVDALGNLRDKQGNSLVSSGYGMYDGFQTGIFSEGYYFIGSKALDSRTIGGWHNGYRGWLLGENTIDLRDYLVYNAPFFKNGYCVLGLENERGELFAGVIDKTGNFVFEPVKGEVISHVVQDNAIIVKQDTKYISVNLNGDILELPEYVYYWETDGYPAGWVKVQNYYDGWAEVRNYNQQTGYIDQYGNSLKIKVPIMLE